MSLILNLLGLDKLDLNKAPEKKNLGPAVVGKHTCQNPHCITTIEQELPQVFHLDEESNCYRCEYCEAKAAQ